MRGYAIEALESNFESKNPDFEKVRYDFLAKLTKCEAEKFESPGLGDDLRLESAEISGSSLIYKEETLHFAAIAARRSDTRYRAGKIFRRRIIE